MFGVSWCNGLCDCRLEKAGLLQKDELLSCDHDHRKKDAYPIPLPYDIAYHILHSSMFY